MKNVKIIEITARKCSKKVQPKVNVGDKYFVKSTGLLKDGTEVLECYTDKKAKDTIRINLHRFRWKYVTMQELQEQHFNDYIKEDRKMLQRTFNFTEQMRIALVPHFLQIFAWKYAEKAVKLGAKYKIDILRNLSRATKHVRELYDAEVEKCISYDHRKHIEQEVERIQSEINVNLQTLFYTVNNELIRVAPDYPYGELRTYAIISMLFIQQVDKHNAKMTKMIRNKVGSAHDCVRMEAMDRLYYCMDGYAGECGKFNYNDQNVLLGMKVVNQKIEQTNFSSFMNN